MNYEQIRQQVAKKYKTQINDLKFEVNRYKELYCNECQVAADIAKQLSEAQIEIERLKRLTSLSEEQLNTLKRVFDSTEELESKTCLGYSSLLSLFKLYTKGCVN